MADLLKKKQGASIVELVIAIALFSLMASAAVGLLLLTVNMDERSQLEFRLRLIMAESRAALHSVAARDLAELNLESSGLEFINRQWVLAGEGSSELLGKTVRVIEFSPVYRASTSRQIVDISDPEAVLDPGSRIAEIKLTRQPQFGQAIVRTEKVLLVE